MTVTVGKKDIHRIFPIKSLLTLLHSNRRFKVKTSNPVSSLAAEEFHLRRVQQLQPPTPSKAEVKERVGLYLYSPPELHDLFYDLFYFIFCLHLVENILQM
jgi:hypothetical protein